VKNITGTFPALRIVRETARDRTHSRNRKTGRGKSEEPKVTLTAAAFSANFPGFRLYFIINIKLNGRELRVVIGTVVVQNNPSITESR
jgi:hypothetical protein